MTDHEGEVDQLSVMKGGTIMRRIFFGTGILVLGLATLMWATAPIIAQHSGGGHASGGGAHASGGGGHASGGGAHASGGGAHVSGGGGHAAASMGSVHYGARAVPTQVGPPVRAGAVRSEHYAGSPSRGAYRNPYGNAYFRRFPPGYRPFLLNGAQYYGYDGLPLGYQLVVVNGITYYLFNGVYYLPYIYGGQTVYLVVPNPMTLG
jgi:hypothetical protein